MRLFVKKIIISVIPFVIVLLLVSIANFIYIRNEFSFKIPANITTLVIGNSHPECAINDKYISNVFNYSKSGNSLMYTLVMLRGFLESNEQINTIVVGYDYYDIHSNKDLWFYDDKYLKSKLPLYLPFLRFTDIKRLLSIKPFVLIEIIPQFLVNSTSMIIQDKMSVLKNKDLGGYNYIKISKIDEAIKEKRDNMKQNAKSIQPELSIYQMMYFREIYNLLRCNNKKMILLNTPVYKDYYIDLSKTLVSEYLNFASEEMPLANIIDHSDFSIPLEGYRDLSHLNYTGAEIYSRLLQDKGFLPLDDFLN